MEHDVYHTEDETPQLGRLSPRAQRLVRGSRLAAFVLAAAAVLIGAAAGLVWVNQPGFNREVPYADGNIVAAEIAKSTPAQAEPTSEPNALAKVIEQATGLQATALSGQQAVVSCVIAPRGQEI